MSEKKKVKIDFKYTPHKKQELLHQYCNDPSKYFVVVNAGRQSGKTFAAQIQGVKWALENNNVRVWFVAPSETQANRIFKELVIVLKNSNLIKQATSSKGNISILLVNESIIDFKSGAMEDNLRGYSVDYMIIDEASFIDRRVFEEILLPTLNVKGKKILIISTPRGRNWFYEYYVKGDSFGIKSNPEFASLKFTYMDNPLCNKNLIETIKKSIPDKIFKQEYLAEWIDGGQVFNNINDRMIGKEIKEPIIGVKYFMGVDIGFVDYTVLTVIDNKGEVVHIDRFRELPVPVVKQRILSCIEKWKIDKCIIERNGVGLPISEELLAIYPKKIIPFNTTNSSKSEIISSLINAFESGLITLFWNEDLYKELNGFGFEFSSTGKIFYKSIYGHDDMVMSLAFSYYAYSNFKSSRRTIVMT